MPGSKRSAVHQDQTGKNDGLVLLHRARFIEWQPAPIVALASSHDGSLAVAARETGDIELYDTSSWHSFQTLPGSASAVTSCLAVVDEEGGAACRLFSAGLDGVIHELDVESRTSCASTDSYGGAVWQLEPEPMGAVEAGALPRLAAACDDGCIRLFSVEVGIPGAGYLKSFPPVEGRTLAVAWHPDGSALASAGTDGCVHVWSVAGQRELLRITAGEAAGRGEPLVVWDLLYLPDGTLVSADSDGGVQFWDGRFGTLLAKFSVHQADVLRLAASPDGHTVFAAGVDPQLAVFQLVQGADGTPQWVYLSSKRLHTHDVRALCVVHGKLTPEAVLVSGGNDTQLLAHPVGRFLKEHPQKLNPCPQRPLLHASAPPEAPAPAAPVGRRGADKAARQQHQHQRPPWLLCSQRNQLDLWQLGGAAGAQPGSSAAAAGGEPGEGALVPPGAPPLHLARFQTKGGDFLVAAALSPAGDRVAFSDARRVRAFALTERPLPGGEDPASPGTNTPRAAALAVAPLPLPADLPPASHLAWLPGKQGTLVACAMDGTIRVLDLGASAGEDLAAGAAAGGAGEAAAGSSSRGVLVIRDVHNLRHKAWAKRDRHRSAVRRIAPAVDLLVVSPDGRWLAVAARQRLCVIDLSAPKPAAVLLPPAADPPRPLTALAFTADSATLLAATAAPGVGPAAPKTSIAGITPACHVAAYSVATAQPSAWAEANSDELALRLAACPGPAAGLACSPAAPGSFLLHSPAAICHVDMAKPLFSGAAGSGSGTAPAGAKRRRGPARPLQTSAPAGENCRILFGEDPILHVQYVAPDSVLVVERSWADVWEGLPAPVYRHRYGT